MDAAAAVSAMRELLADTVTRLQSAGVRDEALAEWKPVRRLLPSQPTMLPSSRAWRLGSLLLDAEGRLYATGIVTRAIQPKDFNADKSVAAEARRDLQRAAVRGRFATGDSVNVDYIPVQLEALEFDGENLVFHDNATTAPLATYITDRLELVLHPF